MAYYYLATPYSNYKYGLEQAYKDAVREAAVLMSNNWQVFSPIVHSHPISLDMDNSRSYDFWIKADLPYMDHSKGIIIGDLEGWQASRGVRFEVEYFAQCRRIDPLLLLRSAPLTLQILDPKTIEWEGEAASNPIGLDIIKGK